jgi:enterochelin esterase family protein
VVFRLDDDPRWTPRRVWFHLRDFGADPGFHREGDQWVARIPSPPVARLEYLVVLEGPDGGEAMVPDPANPRRVRGVFGDKSLVELPSYAPPWWIAVADAADAQAQRDRTSPGDLIPVTTPSPVPGEGIASVRVRTRQHGGDDRILRIAAALGRPAGALVADPDPIASTVVDADADVVVSGDLHVPSDSTPDEPLPLLVVHDGPEYADLAQLLRYLSTVARIEPALRCRVLLMSPVDRDRSYSASPAYARALVTGLLPQVTGSVATRGPVVGVGSSLGGLAMLHAAVAHPGTFGGVFSQSGSFFRPRTDGMERGYRFYDRIVRFVDTLDADPGRLAGLQVGMTCGTGEENLANNRSMARRLARLGVPVALIENPDGHNYTGWRDALDPGLRTLLRAVWGAAGNDSA